MPGLISNKIEWEHSTVQRVTDVMIEKYDGILANTVDAQGAFSAFYTPYQFTLPILQALYYLFEKNGDDVKVENILGGELKALNPARRDLAFDTSLRAIAYFSWEPESRVFLVRRVFPTYFDFLSVSHIPEGWGVSSVMLSSLQTRFDKGTDVVNGSFFKTVVLADQSNLPYILPYLAEQDRLRYTHVFILPVFHPSPPKSDRDMLGTFLFFINGGDGVPRHNSPEENRLRVFANNLCDATSKLVVLHNRVLAPSPIECAWREVRRRLRDRARIAEVVLGCRDHDHDGKVCELLESAAREFLKALTIPNYYAIRDSANEKEQNNKVAVFLVTARPGVELDSFKRRLLRIVTDTLSKMKIICQVSIKECDLTTGSAFQLSADHKWQRH